MDVKRYVVLFVLLASLSACQSNIDHSNQARTSKKMAKRQSNPAAATYNVQLGVAYLRQGDIERANFKLQLAEKQDPTSVTVLDAKAYFLEMTGEAEEAERYYRKALVQKQRVGMAHNNFGAFLCRQRRYKAADEQFMLAVQDQTYLSPGEAYENAGLCALQNSRTTAAETYFKQALKKQPRLANSALVLARINYNKGHYVQAKHYLQRFNQVAKPEPESLKLSILIADREDNGDLLQSSFLALEKQFPDSYEYKLMREKYGHYS